MKGLGTVRNQLEQVQRSLRDLPSPRWPPVVDLSLATDVELRDLEELLPLADAGVASARARCRAICMAVNERGGAAGGTT